MNKTDVAQFAGLKDIYRFTTSSPFRMGEARNGKTELPYVPTAIRNWIERHCATTAILQT